LTDESWYEQIVAMGRSYIAAEMQHGGREELRDSLANNILWMQVVPWRVPVGKAIFPLAGVLGKWMIKVLSADIWRIERGRRAKSGRFVQRPKRKVWSLSAFGQCLMPFKRGDWRKGVGVRWRAIARVAPFAGRVLTVQ
jgi:hypothetical protein